MLLLLVLATTLAFSNAYPGTTPPDNELYYQYNARMRVGTYKPVTYASQLILDASLHLKIEKPYAIATLSNIQFKLYNGELDFTTEYKSKALPLPPEAHELENSFRIKYDSNGKALCIVTDPEESEYSRNIKKAIASILQMDINSIQFDGDAAHAFITEERSIYGTNLVDYNVVPVRRGELTVYKHNEVKTSPKWYKYFNINAETFLHGPRLVSPITLDSQRKYEVVKVGDGFRLKYIESDGDIFVHPLKGMAENNYVSVKQTFQLLEKSSLRNGYPPPPPPPPEKCSEDLAFVYDVETESGAMQDMTFGRRPISDKQLIANVKQSLDDLIIFLHENQLTLQAPDLWRGQTINRLQRLLSQFSTSTLHSLYDQLCGDTTENGKLKLEIFYQIIPLVGTRASIIFIKELICSKLLTDKISIDLLRKMPFHLRMPSERLLGEVDELLSLPKPMNASVQHAAILSFATLVHKVFVDRPLFEEQYSNWYDNYTNPHNPFESPVLEKYITKFIDKLKAAEDYATQYLYMQALQNIQVGNVAKYLEPYVKGEVQNSDRHLRTLAIYASLPGQILYPSRAYEIFWPIFTDRNLHLELRIAAYNVLISTRPTMSKLWNIYWYMQSDPNPDLYHYIYTNLISLATSNNPITSDYKAYAQQVVKFLRRPFKPYLTGSYINDFIDPKYGAGAMVRYNIQSTKSSVIFCIELINNVFGVPFRYYSAYFKIEGLDECDFCKPSGEKYSELYELQRIIQALSTLHHNKKISFEYSILKYGQVIEYGVYNQHNINELVDCIKNIVTKGEKWLETYIEIDYIMMKDMVLPNDLGFLTYIQIKTPNLINSQSNLLSDYSSSIINMNGDFRLQNAIRSTYDTTVYNPISDTWHGFHRIRSFDFLLPINFNIAINPKQFAIKLTLRCHKEEEKNTAGLRSHTTIQTYIGDDYLGYLNQSNSNCSPYANVTAGDKYRQTYYLLNADDENTGFNYQLAVFDSEQQLFHKSLLELLQDTLYDKRDLYTDAHTAKLITTAQNLWLHTVLYPGIGISGFLAKAVPNPRQHVSQIDFSFRLSEETNRDEGIHLPSTKYILRSTYTVKAGEKVQSSYELSSSLIMDAGHITNNLKLQLVRKRPDHKDCKICLDVSNNFTATGVVDNMGFSIGDQDGKCPSNEVSIVTNMKGELSDKQYAIDNREYRMYEDCFQTHLYEPNLNDVRITNYNVYRCTEKYLSLRKYNFDIQYTKIPDYLTKTLKLLMEIFQATFVPHSWHHHQMYPYLASLNTMNVQVEFPVHGHELELEVVSGQETHNLTGISTTDLDYIGLYPDNYHYSYKFQWLHRLGLTKTCLANCDTIFTSSYHIGSPFCEGCEWVLLASDTANQTFFVSAQRKTGPRPLDLRVKFQNDVLQILSRKDDYEITLNGKPLSLNKKYYHYDTWFSYKILQDRAHTVALAVYKYGLYIDFNGQTIKMDAPMFCSDLVGECFN